MSKESPRTLAAAAQMQMRALYERQQRALQRAQQQAYLLDTMNDGQVLLSSKTITTGGSLYGVQQIWSPTGPSGMSATPKNPAAPRRPNASDITPRVIEEMKRHIRKAISEHKDGKHCFDRGGGMHMPYFGTVKIKPRHDYNGLEFHFIEADGHPMAFMTFDDIANAEPLPEPAPKPPCNSCKKAPRADFSTFCRFCSDAANKPEIKEIVAEYAEEEFDLEAALENSDEDEEY